ncbi:MAG: hypothetical protein RI906_2120 [Pseudomonadota bacterium]
MVHRLDVHGFPLHGCRLIEASAGTGKTWTIASLYLRLVLGHGQVGHTGRDEQFVEVDASAVTAFHSPLLPSQILVMTFTRAATQELSDRIRARLLEAARWFRQGDAFDSADDLLLRLRADYPDTAAREWAAWQLEKAAAAMDDAAVMTIDAWCQRMLNEHAFNTGSPFDETLIAQDESLLDEAMHDYWRQQCYPLQGECLSRVSEVWKDAHAMVQSVRPLIRFSPDWGSEQSSLTSVVERFIADEHATLAQLGQAWGDRVQTLSDWFACEVETGSKLWDRKQLSPKNVHRWLGQLAAWAADPVSVKLSLTDTARKRLSVEGIRSAYKGDPSLLTLPDTFQALEILLDAIVRLPNIASLLRRHAAACIAARLAELKQQSRSFSFIDMTRRLEAALTGPQGKALRQRIIDQYPVALIDEFQDTSPEQYRLFNALYRCADHNPDTALILIGDPKQSIYGFRGADIYSYLKAREACANRIYALDTNHRATHDMVAAVNAWFTVAEARVCAIETPAQPGGAFRLRHGPVNPMPFMAVSAKGRDAVFQTQAGQVPALTVQYDLNLSSTRHNGLEFAARCAEQIVSWLNDASTGFMSANGSFTRLRPAHIAVLVRSRSEAALVRRALTVRGLASVFQSDQDSVFASHEAADLLRWLRAVALPGDIALARAALATRTLELSLSELSTLAHDEDAFDAAADKLRALQSVWQQRGVLAMVRRGLHVFNCPARWLAQGDGERRLTTVLHLAELLQQASTEVEGEQSLIHWLARRIDESTQGSSDEQVLRLESDADLIQVITIHKSKGLEYPVVCLPFACRNRPLDRRQTQAVSRVSETGERTLSIDFTDAELADADLERQREDLRLFYVALTRARHAVWMGFATLKQGNKKDCLTHQSAPGYLLAGDTPLHESQWLEPLQALAHSVSPKVIRLEPAPAEIKLTRMTDQTLHPPLQAVQAYQAEFERRWAVGSYSSMTRNVISNPATPVHTHSPADDEQTSVDNANAGRHISQADLYRHTDYIRDIDLTDDPDHSPPADLTGSADSSPASAAWHRFPGGARAGDFVHGILEWLATESFEFKAKPWLSTSLYERCRRAGYPRHEEQLMHWMQTLLSTRLPSLGASLPQLRSRMTEMEFWMPAASLKAEAVDALCRQYLLDGCDRPVLPSRTLNGMLMGFADLVFEHEGRYWVLDYKTNRLWSDAQTAPSSLHNLYTLSALRTEMARHRYDVQAAIYLLALHRQLRARLGAAYNPGQQLGGAIYWFIRGLDGPARGEYAVAAHPPVLKLLDALDQLLSPSTLAS